MTDRELILLGTASQVPTRQRNHHATALRFDDELLLFDPGEGTQRQLLYAGLSAAKITRVLLTHFHGDHCLGLPGVLQRMAVDRPGHTVDVVFPASGQDHLDALRRLAATGDAVEVREHPGGAGDVRSTRGTTVSLHESLSPGGLTITAAWLDHRVDTLGYRVAEPDGRRILPERLDAVGVSGADIGRLQRDGAIAVDGRTVTLDEVSEHRPGQSVAFVMDTRWCEGAVALAEDADVLVCEATFLERHADLAPRYGHLTAAQAARLAAEAGARRLVLTHFSQRYPDPGEIAAEAGAVFDDVVVAADLDRVSLPPRR